MSASFLGLSFRRYLIVINLYNRYLFICLLGLLYDKEHRYFNRVHRIQFVAAAVPPGSCGVGGGVASHPINPRLTRLMTVLSFSPLSTDTLKWIYSSVVQSWLEEFPGYSLTHHKVLAQVSVW